MVKKYLSLVKFSHTIFALPFALMGYIIGTSENQEFDWRVLLLIFLCMVFARSAAMAFNRYVDWRIDAKNPRTSMREIPAGLISPKRALWFVILNVVGFLFAAGMINPLCLVLAPVAIFVVLFYSYSKRFTALCHIILGIGLGLAPVGAYVAVTGQFSAPIIYLGLSVVFWVAGFDVIYSLQDDDFDASQNLHSIPVWLGRPNALLLSRTFHLITAVSVCTAWYILYHQMEWVGGLTIAGLLFFISALFYQHTLVRPNDLSRVDRAFFTTNGIASLVFGLFVILDYFV